MHLPKPCEFGVLQARDHPEYTALFAPAQVGLKSDQVVQGTGQIVLAELDDGIRPSAGPGVFQPDRPHRAERQRLVVAGGKLLDREAALEEIGVFLLKSMERDSFGGLECLHEANVFLLGQWAVDVIAVRFQAARVATGSERDIHVNCLGLNQRCDRVVEEKVICPTSSAIPEASVSAVSGPVAIMHGRSGISLTLLANQRDLWVLFNPFRHFLGKKIAIHCKRRTGGNGRLLRACQQQRAKPSQFGLEQSRRAFRRVRAEEFEKTSSASRSVVWAGVDLRGRIS